MSSTVSSVRLLLDESGDSIADDILRELSPKVSEHFTTNDKGGQLLATAISNRQVLSLLATLRASGWSILASDVFKSGSESNQVLTRTMYLEKRIDSLQSVTPSCETPQTPTRVVTHSSHQHHQHSSQTTSPLNLATSTTVTTQDKEQFVREDTTTENQEIPPSSAAREAAHFKKLLEKKRKDEEERLKAMDPEERKRHEEEEQAKIEHDKLKSKHSKNMASTFNSSGSKAFLLRGRGRGLRSATGRGGSRGVR